MGIKLTDDEEKIFLIWEEHWLKEWPNLQIQDKKVLAALYWEKLTDEQKEEFENREFIEMEKIQQKRRMEFYNDPAKMRQHFITNAAPLMDDMINLALGNKKPSSTENQHAINEVWSVLKQMITTANNPAPLLDLKGKDISEQIDMILGKVATGDLDLDQAKEFMSLVSSGFNLKKLPDMIAQLERLEATG